MVRGRPRDEDARARVVVAAAELFVRQGYVATTTASIAERAQVAVATIYSSFGSKLGVLAAAHDHAVAGDAEATPLLEREWMRTVSAARTALLGWRIAAEHLAASTTRAAPMLAVIRGAAAEPSVDALQRDLRAQRRSFARSLADILVRLPGASAQDEMRVADLIYAGMSAESYALFVEECGWSPVAWQRFVEVAVASELSTADG